MLFNEPMSNASLKECFLKIEDFQLFDKSDSMSPCRMTGYHGEKKDFNNISSSFYLIVLSGEISLSYKSMKFNNLPSLSFAVCPGEVSISGQGQAIIIEKFGYRGLFQLGLIEESKGRLCYIDNASSTLLVAPARLGDPCLNLLTFPGGVIQSSHIHPTVRFGAIIWGSGECLWGPEQKQIKLTPGVTFCIPETQIHSFNSFSEGLGIVAFHPDSDVGPTDFSHPMLNRTYLIKK